MLNFRPSTLPSKLIMLAKKHFNLRSTSITGIPMKVGLSIISDSHYFAEPTVLQLSHFCCMRDLLHIATSLFPPMQDL